MLDPVTIRYTEALFGLARREGALDTVQSDVEQLAKQIAAPKLAAFLVDARIPAEQRREKLRVLLSGTHQLTQNFVDLLFDKRRESVLHGLGEAFHRRSLEERGAAEGVVESARPLGAADVSQLALALGKRLGKDVKLANRVNPDVLGGVRVIVGSKMIDSSLRGRLDGLRKKMLEAPLPSLQDA